MVTNLNVNTFNSLKSMNLSNDTNDKIANLIQRYTMPKDFSGRLSYLVFRVVEAFKSIAFRSEWQLTKQAALSEVLTNLENMHNGKSLYNTNDISNLKQNKVTKKSCDALIERRMNTLVKLHQELPAPVDNRDFQTLFHDQISSSMKVLVNNMLNNNLILQLNIVDKAS